MRARCAGAAGNAGRAQRSLASARRAARIEHPSAASAQVRGGLRPPVGPTRAGQTSHDARCVPAWHGSEPTRDRIARLLPMRRLSGFFGTTPAAPGNVAKCCPAEIRTWRLDGSSIGEPNAPSRRRTVSRLRVNHPALWQVTTGWSSPAHERERIDGGHACGQELLRSLPEH